MEKYGFKSIYMKFVIVFMAILWISSFAAFRASSYYFEDNMMNTVKAQLYNKANLTLELIDKYSMEPGDLSEILKNGFLEPRMYTSLDELVQKGITLSQTQQDKLDEGQIIESKLSGPIGIPFVIFKADNTIVVLSPNLKNNMALIFIKVIRNVLIICAGLGTLLIAIASRMIVNPIKRLTEATKEISKGNFDVKIRTTSRDEIGQLADHFNVMTDELKKIEYLRKDFISSVSHEFRTPMTSIQGFAKLLKTKDLSREQEQEYMDIIISETGRLENLSSNLLKLSNLENQTIHEEHKTFFLDEQIRRVILLLENKWSEKDIELDLDLDKVSFKGDEELMYQVWTNLIANAIKFSHRGGLLEVSLKKDSSKIKAAITDYGLGIEDKDKPRIFEKFYKGDKSRSKEGSGLGLSIVKKIVELHGGTIYFDSKIGIGTSFVVELKI